MTIVNQEISNEIGRSQSKMIGDTSAMALSTVLASTAISAIYTAYNAAAIRLQANIMMQVTTVEAFQRMTDIISTETKS